MARGFSKAILTGNITRDPEMRTTSNGSNVCSFSVAVNRTYRDASGNNQESVSFIDCVAWGRAAEIINQYAKKGTGILVSGRLEQRSWEDKNTGQKRSRTEVVVEDFNFLGGGGDRDGANRSYASEAGYSNAGENAASSSADVVPEEIPENIDLGEIPF